MKLFAPLTGTVLAVSITAVSTVAVADQTVRCESKDYRHNECRIDKHGYVRLSRQLSRADCIQGRNWDYDRRHIWVDDGCGAEFVVENRHHTDDHDDHKGEKAAAAVAALALLAAAAAGGDDSGNNNSYQQQDRYNDDRYGRGGHTSYIPDWMIGDFVGYNPQQRTEVMMSIDPDGRARARVDGVNLSGYVNDERLFFGNTEFYLERDGSGFNTIQANNTSNQVHYTRR